MNRLRDRVVGAIEEIALITETSSVTTDLDQKAIQDLEKEVGNVMVSSSFIISRKPVKICPNKKNLPTLNRPNLNLPNLKRFNLRHLPP